MHTPTIETITPFPIEELPRVWFWLQEAGSSLFNDQGPQTLDEFVDDQLSRTSITWGVYRDGELGGWISYEPVTLETGNAHCVFRKAFWGGKTTRPALEQVVESLWEMGVQRIGMLVPDDNHAIQRMIVWLGGEKEALWYAPRTADGQRLTRKGVPMSVIQYGLYREEWYEKRNQDGATGDVAPVITAAMAGRVGN